MMRRRRNLSLSPLTGHQPRKKIAARLKTLLPSGATTNGQLWSSDDDSHGLCKILITSSDQNSTHGAAAAACG